jgi:hypothetical protein
MVSDNIVYDIGGDTFKLKTCPTQRAVDAGESVRFQAVFYALAFFRSDSVPPSAPAPLTRAVRRQRNSIVEKELCLMFLD